MSLTSESCTTANVPIGGTARIWARIIIPHTPILILLTFILVLILQTAKYLSDAIATSVITDINNVQ